MLSTLRHPLQWRSLFERLKPAANFHEGIRLSAGAACILRDNPNASMAFEKLLTEEMYADACRLLARVLPIRHAIWWSCVCSWHESAKDAAPKREIAAFEACVRWVCVPDFDRHIAVGEAAELMGVARPIGCVAAAAQAAGYLIDPTSRQAPPSFQNHRHAVAARMAAAAVVAAAFSNSRCLYPTFLMMGHEAGCKLLPWEQT